MVKGILTAEDAIKAADLGVAAVMVSNHGGRQLDTAPATVNILENTKLLKRPVSTVELPPYGNIIIFFN